ncbi:hypothetical protein [Paenibacillus sp. EPM92]|uniref:hypothetical protein n=1 Tax=Paenibacillus sp. EPM92 TaxID=1561195 RepID=UPI0019161110|nr:hypothetical protein [Paenibacillus sp. EPM92]
MGPEKTNKPTTKWKQIASWMQDIHDQIDAINFQGNEKHDYYRILDKLRQELMS